MSSPNIDELLGLAPSELAPNEAFWRLPAVMARVGLSKSEIYRRAKEATFPKSRKYQSGASGDKAAFWLASEIRRWQQQELNQVEQQW